ncbi:Protein of unknown function [Roseivivax lentus]|uniref:Uncharacterized protein n=1 Tax=Roseivivax lentus TaxID=633194 RepID=A0A1N7MSB0_9RHOB|nr:DUF2798 domain-containing protein [Roseivivax lentus]SIS88942.1 Protein of unknown function [Roseivivax lentus]
MINRKHVQRLSSSLVMSSFMSMALSDVFSFLEFGISWTWLDVWGQSILVALPIAFSLDMLLGGKLRAFSGKLADKAASAWP